jgi:hypothetical protein
MMGWLTLPLSTSTLPDTSVMSKLDNGASSITEPFRGDVVGAPTENAIMLTV